MKRTGKSLSHPVQWLLAAAVASLMVVWGLVYHTLSQSAHERLQEAQATTRLQAQRYAENARSTIKRLDELLLDLRANWHEDWGRFAKTVQARQAHASDITFQVSVINAEGYLAFSSPAPATNRMDLRDREYFRVHKGSTQAQDRLFISRPLKGRTTAKWSIQFTRPIWRAGAFAGVIVALITPDTLSHVHANLHLSNEGLSGMVRDTGEVMAYYPKADEMLGKTATWLDTKMTNANAGDFMRLTPPDGIERVLGYHKLPEYQTICFVAESLEYAMQPHRQYRTAVLLSAGAVSMVLLVFSLLIYRKLTAHERGKQQLIPNEKRQPVPRTAAQPSGKPVVVTRRNRASSAISPVQDVQVAHATQPPAQHPQHPQHPLPAPVAEPAPGDMVKTVEKAIDIEQVLHLLREILPRLEQKRFSAIPRFQTLQKLLAGSQHAQAMDEAGELLLEMRFDQVLERVHHIMQTAGWDITDTKEGTS